MLKRCELGWRAGRVTFLFLLVTMMAVPSHSEVKGLHKYLMYVGTNTDKGSKGIYAYTFNSGDGRLEPLGLMAEITNPSFLAVPGSQPFLYSVSEINNYRGQHSGGLAAYRADPKTGHLTLLNQVASIGEGPCYLSLDKTGKFVLTANYGSGSVAVFPRLPDGKLGALSGLVQHLGASVDPDRQKGPHAHAIETTADNKYAIAVDLGLDELLVYNFDPERGSLRAAAPPYVKLPPGSGPRHLALHPNQRYVYVANELDSSVSFLTYDQGVLTPKQKISSLSKPSKDRNYPSEIQVDAKGRFLYVSNRGADSIAVFRIDPKDGTLSLIQDIPSGGKFPRYFSLDPSGRFLLAGNQNSDNIVIFKIRGATGKLTRVREVSNIISPECFAFLAME